MKKLTDKERLEAKASDAYADWYFLDPMHKDFAYQLSKRIFMAGYRAAIRASKRREKSGH
jgi:hypothetical protein